jgi:glutamine amidotransferase
VIGIIDYGLGNIRAFVNVYKYLGISTVVVTKSSEIPAVTKLILPGVGSFDYALKLLETSGMLPQINQSVLINKVPILGVCVGMQMLCETSEEGQKDGLGWVDAHVKHFQASVQRQVPHMGWNEIEVVRNNGLFEKIGMQGYFYFLHSYYVECHNPDDVIAKVNYGEEYVCALNKDNIYGIQFHPEKSHNCGVKLLQHFAEI